MAVKNEVDLIKTSNFNVNFEPATIKIENKKDIEEAIKAVATHYDKTVYADGDLAGIQQSHKELNKLRTGLDESRKDVKREFNKPLVAFENEVKELVKEIDKPLNDLKDMRDEILDAQEEARADALEDYLNKKLEAEKLVLDDIEFHDSWTNKGNWTDKLNPRKPLKDEIDRAIKLAVEENKKKIAERELLKQFFKNRGTDAEGWIAQLEYREATDIIQHIQEQDRLEEEAKREQERIEKAEAEAEARANQTADELFDEPADDLFDENNDDLFDAPVDDLFDEPTREAYDEPADLLSDPAFTEPTITNTIQVTGTVEQLAKLNNYLVTSGIDVKQV